MPEPSYVQKVAARRAALPLSPVLDFVDYMIAVCGIDRAKLGELAKQETFLACLAGFRTLNRFPLGYVALYFLKHRTEALPAVDDDEAVDCMRIVSYCQDLPPVDPRHLPEGKSRAEWAALYPNLIPNYQPGSDDKVDYREKATREMTGFVVGHPLRKATATRVETSDEDDYLDYWMARSEEQIAPYLANERFCAGLEAWGMEMLTFHGMLRKVYGRDYYERVLAPRRYNLFEGLEPGLGARALKRLVNDVASGRRPIPPDLRQKYPGIYVEYQPENFGDDYL